MNKTPFSPLESERSWYKKFCNTLKRLQQFTPRQEKWEQIVEKFEEFAEIYEEAWAIIHEDRRFACPVCHAKKEGLVLKNGHDENGIQKCICTNRDDHGEIVPTTITIGEKEVPVYSARTVDSSAHDIYFRATTSYEAQRVLLKLMKKAILLLAGGSTYEFISHFLGVSTYFVELCSHAAANLALAKRQLHEVDEEDVISIFTDFSGSLVSKKAAFASAVINGERQLFIVTGESSDSAASLLSTIRDALEQQGVDLEERQTVITTDGGSAWLQPVWDIFPRAIHVRQIHDEKKLGIVLVHFKAEVDGETTPFTLRCRWDLFAENPTSSPILDLDEQDSVELYRRRLLKSDPYNVATSDERAQEEQEEGTCNTMHDHENEDEAASENNEKEQTRADTTQPNESRSTAEEESSERKKPAQRVFRGSLEQLVEEKPFVAPVIAYLKAVFGGQYITSNAAEWVFCVKSRLASARGIKAGTRYLRAQLLFSTHSYSELEQMLDHSLDPGLFRFIAPLGSASSTSVDKTILDTLTRAVTDQEPVIMTYEDAEGAISHRCILPHRLRERSGHLYVDAFCFNKQADRTFRLDRVHSCSLLSKVLPSKPIHGGDTDDLKQVLHTSMREGEPLVIDYQAGDTITRKIVLPLYPWSRAGNWYYTVYALADGEMEQISPNKIVKAYKMENL